MANTKVIATKKLLGTAYYAKVHRPEPNTLKEGKLEYSMQLQIDEKTAKELKALRVPVSDTTYKKDSDEVSVPGPFVRLTTSRKPEVVDAKTQSVPETILIGNGSKVKVEANIFTYPPKSKGQTGVAAGLKGVQVLELVEYQGKSSFEEEEGFTVGTSSTEDDDEVPF